MTGKKIHSLKATISSIIKVPVIVVVVILFIHYLLSQNWGYFTVNPAQTFYNIYKCPQAEKFVNFLIKIERSNTCIYSYVVIVLYGFSVRIITST